MAQEILITTTENIPGKHYEIIGEVFWFNHSVQKCD